MQFFWILVLCVFIMVLTAGPIAIAIHYYTKSKWLEREVNEICDEEEILEELVQGKDQTIGYLKALIESKDAEIKRIKITFADTLDNLSAGNGHN